MVGILEEIRITTMQRSEQVENAMKEIFNEEILDNTYVFEKGKIYGIVCEQGEGGELLSSLISGRITAIDEKVFFNNREKAFSEIQNRAWYVGKSEYSSWPIKREISARKAINKAIKKYGRFRDMNDLVEQFGLTAGRLNYKISSYSGEKWRVSLAIGYASKKQIFCFPWMNTAYFNHVMLSSSVYRFFRKMKEEDLIIILPTSRKENIQGFVDSIIEINNPSFKFVASEHPDFKLYF